LHHELPTFSASPETELAHPLPTMRRQTPTEVSCCRANTMKICTIVFIQGFNSNMDR
jgi:hypothetical protein